MSFESFESYRIHPLLDPKWTIQNDHPTFNLTVKREYVCPLRVSIVLESILFRIQNGQYIFAELTSDLITPTSACSQILIKTRLSVQHSPKHWTPKHYNQTQISSLNLIFHNLMKRIVLSLEKGAFPKHLHAVFCQIK